MGQSLDFSQIPPLSEAEIEENSYKLDELWMIHHKKKIYGPYHVDKVKEIAIANPKDLEPSSACNLARGRWFYFFDNTEFQHRNDQEFYKPFVIANEEIKVYANEKEYGPYEYPELVHLLKQKKFRFVDLFSVDNGESWRKIYEIDGLDRRALDENQLKLPDIPDMTAYTSEQLKFIKKAPSNHNVVLELKKIDPQPNQQKTRKEKASSAHARRVRAEIRQSNKSEEKGNSLVKLVIAFVIILVVWTFFKGNIKNFFGSNKKAKFSNNDFQQRNFKRKVSKFNLGLKPAKRETPRVRVTPPPREKVVEESRTEPEKVQQKEYNTSTYVPYDETDEASYDNADDPAQDIPTSEKLMGITGGDIAIGDNEEFYDRDDSFFPETTAEPPSRDFFAEDEGYSEVPSNDFLQNDVDYYPEDEY